MLRRFLPRSRTAIIATSVAGGLVLAGGGIATGAALSGSPSRPAAASSASPSTAGHPRAGARKAAAAEVVTSVTSDSVTVDTAHGAKTYALTGTTTYREGTTTVQASAVQAGDRIRIRIVPGSAGHPVAQLVSILPSSSALPSSPATPSPTA